MNYRSRTTQDIINIQKSTLQIQEITKEIKAMSKGEDLNEYIPRSMQIRKPSN